MTKNKNQEKLDIAQKISELEQEMAEPDFWSDKDLAQQKIKDLGDLKAELAGQGKYDQGSAIVTILAGAGGDDAEDFASMLFTLYSKYAVKHNFDLKVIHQNQNEQGGYRNITFELMGKGVYGQLKNESGVHRLVRLSPFNAKKLRHTSFALVEVIPELAQTGDVELKPEDLKIEFTRSSGPGGQNVNKRETAVRVTHLATGLTVHSESERSQQQNRELALTLLRGKIYKRLEEERLKKEQGLYISKTTEIEWGNQIRSYVLHPYKMVKDHRTDYETSDVEAVLNGDIEDFLKAEKDLKFD
ncbi:MAG: peptide chain release factor 2 [Candidatus Vogelbacteria bacterium CG22_combo_CG10-13_8_21_14_all_37_9]|uniref:Peptide chain release factor 2 n=1 Tax=Candidatus Vogelbacteria bacterium CG22_combo_CG10-13_8_21_14_all_37_9 TaxID=1975046 RepID=A0A2H0BKQ8_9BACT|nr:MAG: peptide chain release factor 2 [Candidatus Vogelbacteria bacterium CG22_combo_CG10-13_8_21_14_all_37_9]